MKAIADLKMIQLSKIFGYIAIRFPNAKICQN